MINKFDVGLEYVLLAGIFIQHYRSYSIEAGRSFLPLNAKILLNLYRNIISWECDCLSDDDVLE